MKREIQIGAAAVGLMLIFSVALGIISGSSRDVDDEFDFGETKITTTTYETTVTEDGDEQIITTTEVITTTEPPETTETEPPETTTTTPGTKPLIYEGKVAVTGEFGVYDAGGNPVKAYPLSYKAEGRGIAYYEARVDKIEILGGSGLVPGTFVLYIRTKVWAKQNGQWVAEDVIIADDIKIYMSDMQFMHGYGIDGIVTQRNTEWGVLDLSEHWYGYYNRENVPKKAVQYMSIGDVYKRAGIPSACALAGWSIIIDDDCPLRCPAYHYPSEDCSYCVPLETTTPTPPATTTTPAPIRGGEPGPTQTTTVKFLFEAFVECHDKDGKWYSAGKEPHSLQVDIVDETQTCTLSVIGIGAGGGMGRWFLLLVIIIGGYLFFKGRE